MNLDDDSKWNRRGEDVQSKMFRQITTSKFRGKYAA